MYVVYYDGWQDLICELVDPCLDFDALVNWQEQHPETKVTIRDWEGNEFEVSIGSLVDHAHWRNS